MMTKLKKVYVDGYKNLVDCEAELHDFNVLVGANNSGKSNFLEVFSFARGLITGSDELRKAIFEQASTPRGFSSVCYLKDHECRPITICFVLENYSQSETVKEITYSLTVQCAKIVSKEKKGEVGFVEEMLSIKDKTKTGRAIILLSRKEKLLKVRTKSGNFSSSKVKSDTSVLKVIPELYDPSRLDERLSFAAVAVLNVLMTDVIFASADELRERIGSEGEGPFKQVRTTSFDLVAAVSKIYKHKKHKLLYEQFRSVVCQILDVDDIRFSSVEIPEKIRKDSKDMPKVVNFLELRLPGQPFSDIRNYSDGTLVVIAILTMVFSPGRQSKFICIEEPENCLHPKALKTLISFLIQKATSLQILITTHSQYVLNNVSPEDVLVARIYEDGGTRFERISNIKELKRRLAKGYIGFGDLLATDFKEEEAVL